MTKGEEQLNSYDKADKLADDLAITLMKETWNDSSMSLFAPKDYVRENRKTRPAHPRRTKLPTNYKTKKRKCFCGKEAKQRDCATVLRNLCEDHYAQWLKGNELTKYEVHYTRASKLYK